MCLCRDTAGCCTHLAHTFQLTSAVPPIFHFSGWYTSRGSGFNAVPFIPWCAKLVL